MAEMDEYEEPLSPEVPMHSSSICADQTPKRPVSRRMEQESDQSESGVEGGINESISEIKSLVKMLCKKVDKNERCLNEIQQAHSR